MYKLHLDRELAKDVFINSSKKTIDWVVNAIANIVVADGIIEKHEFVALQEAFGGDSAVRYLPFCSVERRKYARALTVKF